MPRAIDTQACAGAAHDVTCILRIRLTCTCAAQVTGLAVSDRHPYMFSCSLDKEVKCWDMEYNKVRVCGAQS